jgi:hypothetical protein
MESLIELSNLLDKAGKMAPERWQGFPQCSLDTGFAELPSAVQCTAYEILGTLQIAAGPSFEEEKDAQACALMAVKEQEKKHGDKPYWPKTAVREFRVRIAVGP